jgi:hypothetical protein
MVVYFVEITSVKKLVERVKAGKIKPKDEVIQSSESFRVGRLAALSGLLILSLD